MSEVVPTFSLLDEPWIPVIYHDNRAARVSLLGMWDELHTIREIWYDSPTVVAVLHRLFMAIMYRAMPAQFNSLEHKADVLNKGEIAVDSIRHYLESHRDRFDLFHPTMPFYQTVALRDDPTKNHGPNTILRHSAIPHFDRSDDKKPLPILPAYAVLWLLEHQGYALGGRITNSADSVYAAQLVNGLVVLLRGRNLFETLVCSMPVYNTDEELGNYKPLPVSTDRPAWESGAPTQMKRMPYGWLDVLTWQSRRVLLLPEDASDGWVVRKVIVSGGYDLEDRVFRDPMQFMRHTKDGARLLKLNTDRAMWRDLIPCLAWGQQIDAQTPYTQVDYPNALIEYEEMRNTHLYDDIQPRLQILGIANDKSKMELWRQEVMSVSVNLFANDDMKVQLMNALKICTDGDSSVSSAFFRFAEAMIARGGDRAVRKEDCTALSNSLNWRVKYWGNLESMYDHQIIQRLESILRQHATNPEQLALQSGEVIDAWRTTLVRYAEQLYRSVASASDGNSRELRALMSGEQALQGSFYKAGLKVRKEVRDEQQ
jgi:CRISPR system Cascade subunit CasA